jgi:hypothetical protein
MRVCVYSIPAAGGSLDWWIGGIGSAPIGPFADKIGAELHLDRMREAEADFRDTIRDYASAHGRI